MRIGLVANPSSGRGRHNGAAEAARRALLGAGHEVGQGPAAGVVQGGEDVVEQEDGLAVAPVGVDVAAQHLV